MTGKELEVVDAEVVDAEIVAPPVPLSEGKAKQLDKRIRQAQARFTDEGVKLLDLLKEAEIGQIHVALGLPSWRAYVRENVHISPADEVERKQMVSLMSGKGFSQRDIADAVGANQSTISRDLAEGDAPASGETVGRDEKVYPRQPKKEPKQEPLDVDEVEPPEPKPQPVSKDFADEMGYLANSVSSFSDILADERFVKARKTIAKNHLNKLQELDSEIHKIIDELMS